MFAKTYLGLIAVAVAAVVGWKYYGSGQLAAGLKPPAVPSAFKFDNDDKTGAGPASPQEAGTVIRKAASGVHKCVVNGTVSYTDAPCPNAGAEKAMGGGSVTVVKGQRPSAAAASQSASIPTVRDLLLDKPKPGEQSLQDKQMERAVNQ